MFPAHRERVLEDFQVAFVSSGPSFKLFKRKEVAVL
jgi:hypothetical protein